MIIGLDVGTSYTKVTDGSKTIVYPSLIVYGRVKDWQLGKEFSEFYVGRETEALILEDSDVLRPIHEGRILHESYVELAKYGISKIDAQPKVLATGLPVKSSKKEKEDVKMILSKALNCDVLIFPQPVGTMAHMNVETGVCVDLGFGTTNIVVIADMEYVKGDTILLGVNKIYEPLESLVRSKTGISITPEEMVHVLEGKKVGRIRSGKRVEVSKDVLMEDYEKLVFSWVDKIAGRVKQVLEGLSISLLENFIITGGGVLLPKVFELFSQKLADIGEIRRAEDPIKSNVIGFYILAKKLYKEEKKGGRVNEDYSRSTV